MKKEELKCLDSEYILHSYGRVNAAPEKGKGAVCYEESGKKYIDFTSGIGVNALGYCPDNWAEAVKEQLDKIQHVSNYYLSENAAVLAKMLSENSGMSRAFFCNSGAEANECAIKIARAAALKNGKGFNIITLVNSFHGRTLTTLAATGQDVFHQKFLPLTEGFLYAEAGDIEALKALIDENTAAVMLECVQGEGGVLPMEEDYLKAVRKLCDENNISMVVDEVQTGIGRTGKFFSYQWAGIIPDVVTCAKGLGGGLPIGCCLVSEKHKDIFAPGDNGSTFGANPVVCAGAREIVKTVSDEKFLSEVLKKGEYIKKSLSDCEEVEFIRGKGMMIGIKLKNKPAKEVLGKCIEEGLLILTAKDLVRFLPPLNISYSEIDEGIKIFRKVIEA